METYSNIVDGSEAVVQRCSVKKVFLEIWQNSQENTCASGLQLYIKKETLAQVYFPVNFVKFLRIPSFIENLWWLLLTVFSQQLFPKMSPIIPACIYMLKVNNRNTRTRCEICSKLTIKIPERPHWRRSGIFIISFEHISNLVLMFLLLLLTCNCRLGWWGLSGNLRNKTFSAKDYFMQK